jgi:hypothetical protein
MANGSLEEPLEVLPVLSALLRGTYFVGALEMDAPGVFPFPVALPFPLLAVGPAGSEGPSSARPSTVGDPSGSPKSLFPFLDTFLELACPISPSTCPLLDEDFPRREKKPENGASLSELWISEAGLIPLNQFV